MDNVVSLYVDDMLLDVDLKSYLSKLVKVIKKDLMNYNADLDVYATDKHIFIKKQYLYNESNTEYSMNLKVTPVLKEVFSGDFEDSVIYFHVENFSILKEDSGISEGIYTSLDCDMIEHAFSVCNTHVYQLDTSDSRKNFLYKVMKLVTSIELFINDDYMYGLMNTFKSRSLIPSDFIILNESPKVTINSVVEHSSFCYTIESENNIIEPLHVEDSFIDVLTIQKYIELVELFTKLKLNKYHFEVAIELAKSLYEVRNTTHLYQLIIDNITSDDDYDGLNSVFGIFGSDTLTVYFNEDYAELLLHNDKFETSYDFENIFISKTLPHYEELQYLESLLDKIDHLKLYNLV